ncbi:MAG: ankyrin repeat domain-containing protein [Akkermansia sp.]|nr:ankyrin repeat domain-containing protein [Akkermansia sp.]
MNEATIQEELFAAICHNEADVVDKLLVAGADANKRFRNQLTPLMVAARAGAHTVIPVLLAHGAYVNASYGLWGRSAFHWLCRQGLTSHYHVEAHTESARALLAAGADAYMTDDSGDTPLILALRHRQKNVIKLIHAYSPIPNGTGDKLLIPWLDVAYLRKSNPYLRRYTDEEIHAYCIAPPEPRRPGATLRRSHPLPFDTAWATKADVYTRNKKGFTALHHAAALGLYEVAAILIDRGAPIDATSRSGATPLMVAARSGRWKVGHLLLAHGADPLKQDINKRNAYDFARRANNRKLFGMI